jgi:hypothetical protein
MELMAIAAGTVAGTCVAGIDPESYAIGAAQLARASLGQFVLAIDFNLEAQAKLIPGQANVGKIFPLIHGREVIDAQILRQIKQTVRVLSRNTLEVTAGVGDAEQETMRY